MFASKSINDSECALNFEQKNKLLTTYPNLYTLYKEIVVTGLSTADDFWSSSIILKDIPLTCAELTKKYKVENKHGIPNGDRSKAAKDKNNMFLQIFHDADAKFKDEIVSGFDSDKFNLQSLSVLPEGYGGIFDENSTSEKLSLARQFNLQSRTILKTFQDATLSIKTMSTNPFYPGHELIEDIESTNESVIDLDSEKFSLISAAHLDVCAHFVK
ncbi:hypothetical protein MXB_2489 [Myxobolus squamalis]|nr:hypothetical protein MXB_2489 [Myxobolus squamalis]